MMTVFATAMAPAMAVPRDVATVMAAAIIMAADMGVTDNVQKF